MIEDLLPRYYAAHGTNGTYETVRTFVVDGHEVAWMKYSGTTTIAEVSGHGQPFESFGLRCECYFTEGVGWQIHPKFGVVGLRGGDGCDRFKSVLEIRKAELHDEYAARFEAKVGQDDFDLLDHFEEIVMDLIARDKRDEFIGEGSNGAHFWGGHFYVQTLTDILHADQRSVGKKTWELVGQHKIELDGMIIQEYTTPPPEAWNESFTYEQVGYTVKASLPAHSRMREDYKLELYDTEGTLLATDFSELMYAPTFGPDTADIAAAQQKAVEMITTQLQAT